MWWALLACSAGTITRPDGTPEDVRTAMIVATGDPASRLLLVANSVVPCRATDTPDDPATVADEEGEALEWWQAKIQAAFRREGALVVLAWLWVDGDVPGTYALAPDGEQEAIPGAGAAAWAYVEEAELSGADDYVWVYHPTDADVVIGATGQAEVGGATPDGRWPVSVALGPNAPVVDADAVTCGEATLTVALLRALQESIAVVMTAA